MRKLAKILMLVAACSIGLQGCYGPFRLTKKLHAWNGTVGDKWIDEAVFLVLAIVPVYGLSVLADALVFNSVEFWTGENPVTKAKSIELDGRQAVLHYRPESRRLRVDLFEKGRPTATVVIEPGPHGMVARGPDGGLLASSEDSGGVVTLTRADGSVLGAMAASELAAKLR